MTSRRLHTASAVPVALLAVAFGFHPIVAAPLFVGVLLPELDTVSDRTHRSWLLHTFLAPTITYQLALRIGVPSGGWIIEMIHFITLGVGLHLVADYIFPRTRSNAGADWPIRPTVGAEPWGLVLLGVSWFIQWFGYLSNTFLPWLIPR